MITDNSNGSSSIGLESSDSVLLEDLDQSSAATEQNHSGVADSEGVAGPDDNVFSTPAPKKQKTKNNSVKEAQEIMKQLADSISKSENERNKMFKECEEQKVELLREKNDLLKKKNEILQDKNEILKEKNDLLKQLINK